MHDMSLAFFYGLMNVFIALTFVEKRCVNTKLYVFAINFLHHRECIFISLCHHRCMILQGKGNAHISCYTGHFTDAFHTMVPPSQIGRPESFIVITSFKLAV